MPPKRRAALQNQYVNATVSKRSRINQASASTATSASGAEPTIPVSSSPEVTMASSQLQGLIREAFEAGMQEARAHIHPPAQPIDVPVPNASAVQTAATPTTVVLTTTPPSTQFTATTVTANMSSAPSTTMAIDKAVQRVAAFCKSSANSSASSGGPNSLLPTLSTLLNASLAPASRRIYDRALSAISQFSTVILGQPFCIPVPHSTVALYVANAYQMGKAPGTITSQLSALGYVHKLNGLNDPTKSFFVRKVIQGATRLAPSFDTRLPITIPILHSLCEQICKVTSCPHEQSLLAAVFTLAFYALARLGELLAYTSAQAKKLLQLADVDVEFKDKRPNQIFITFRHFKHNISGKPHTIPVKAMPQKHCPVLYLINYLKLRGSKAGCLFLTRQGLPFPRKRFDSLVQKCLSLCHLDVSRFKGHSFRIGGASFAANSLGLSDSQIRSLGRWKSDAFKVYIRSQGLANIP
ncbi:uncharacterized protein [Argopecten irradians]|uniref:uncharacterized protein n=1 Tax=Argopecten irradians TaxID=31199 RepID=UPI00371F6A06